MKKMILAFLIACSFLFLSNAENVYADENAIQLQMDGSRYGGELDEEDHEHDMYFIHMEEPGSIELDLKVYYGGCRVILYDLNMNDKFEEAVEKDEDDGVYTKGSMKLYLLPGDYYMEVETAWCDMAEYELTAVYEQAEETYPEPNDTFKQAAEIPFDKVIKGQNAMEDDDYYSFRLAYDTLVTFNATSYDHYMQFVIFNEEEDCVDYWWTQDTAVANTKKRSIDMELSAGLYYVKIETEECGDYELEISKKTSLEECNIQLSESIPGTGEELKAPLKITYAGKTLVEGVDYTLECWDNENFGTATVRIKGIGDFYGELEKQFDIILKIGGYATKDEYKYQFVGDNEVALISLLDKNLSVIDIADEVEIGGRYFDIVEIVEKAFYKNTKLKEVAFSHELERIGAQAFYGCSNLATVNFSDWHEVESVIIFKDAFANCDNLKEVNGLGEKYSLVSGKLRYRVKEDGTLEVVALEDKTATSLTIPTTVKIGAVSMKVTSIAAKSLENSSLKTVEVGKNVTEIGGNAFRNCESLTKVVFTGSKIKIDEAAFTGCSKLKTVEAAVGTLYTIGDFKYEILSSSKLSVVGLVKPLARVNVAKTVKIGEKAYTVTEIAERAFYKDWDVNVVNLPASIVAIREKAFYECYGLEKITFNSAVKLDKYAIQKCDHLETVTGLLKGSIIINGVNRYEMKEDGTLEFVRLENTDTVTLVVPSTISVGSVSMKVTSIASKAVDGTKITSATIGKNVSKIGTSAFENCKYLTKLTLQGKNVAIGTDAFEGCAKLKTVTAEKGAVLTIGNYKYNVTSSTEVAFAGLSKSVTSVSVAKTIAIGEKTYKVTAIADKALRGKSITSATVGANVKKIGKQAFENCKSLTKLTLKGKNVAIGTDAFNNCTKLKTVTAETGTVYTIGNYKYKVTSSTEVAFAGLSKSVTSASIAKTITIGAKSYKITSIADAALSGTSVASVTVGENVKKIGKQAFKDCTKLATITIKSKGLTSVGSQAFTKIKSNAVIKVPSANLKAYKKLFSGKGLPSKATIKAF